jgi:hypothetical protein
MILVLFTGINVKFATHYCGGQVAGTKVSLTGELASCGMETDSDNNTHQQAINYHCCDNSVPEYSICNNYFGSSYKIEEPVSQSNELPFLQPVDFSKSELSIPVSFIEIKPPGIFCPNSVDHPVICIFRI